MAITLSQYDALLKNHYAAGKPESMLFKQFPFLERVKKQSASGSKYVQPVVNGANVRRSVSYNFVQNSITETQPAVAFNVDYKYDYATVAISDEAWVQSDGSDAFLDAFKLANDQGIAALRKSLALKLYRTGTGSIAKLGGSATSATVQALQFPGDAFNFEIGDLVHASAADGGALRTLGASTTGARVVDIFNDSTTATLTFHTALNLAITDVGSTDFLYSNSGDAQNNSTTPTCAMGLLGWSPASTVSLTVSFFGVTRSADSRRLRGQFVANTNSAPIDQQVQQGITALVAQGGMPDAVFMNPYDVFNLMLVSSAKVQRAAGGTAVSGFKAYTFVSSSGEIALYSDPACPQGTAFVCDMSGIKLVHATEGPVTIRKAGDASAVRTSTSAAAWLVDWMSVCNLVIERPGQCLATIQL